MSLLMVKLLRVTNHLGLTIEDCKPTVGQYDELFHMFQKTANNFETSK